MTNEAEMRTETVDPTTKLAVDRTRLAYERTLMAWVRTAVSLITFGFTIYKFFQLERGERRHDDADDCPRLCVLMIMIGLLSLLMATFEHRQSLQALKTQ